MTYRVLIAGDNKSCAEVSGLLREAGYEDMRELTAPRDVAQVTRTFLPDVVLIDAELPDDDAAALARELLQERPIPIIVFASYSQIEKVKAAEASGVAAYIFRPMSKENLMGVIELGMSRFRQCQALHSELGNCQETLRVRKLVEKAKGILMKRNSISEEDAFLKIQKLSRNNNLTMEKVAQSIITASELM